MKQIGNPRNSVTEQQMRMSNKRIGLRLRSIRDEHKRQNPEDYVTQEALAHEVGVSLNTMIRIEGGKTSAQADSLKRIANFWGMSVGDIFRDIPVPTYEEALNAPRIKKILDEA